MPLFHCCFVECVCLQICCFLNTSAMAPGRPTYSAEIGAIGVLFDMSQTTDSGGDVSDTCFIFHKLLE